MKDFNIEEITRGCEKLVVRVSATKNGRKVFKDVDMGGNATSAQFYGGYQVIEALRELDTTNEQLGS